MKIEDIVEDDDLLVVWVIFDVIYKDIFMGIEVVDKNIRWEVMEFFWLKDGIIIEIWGSWFFYDVMDLFSLE